MLTRAHPGPGRAGAGLALVAGLAVGAGLVGWAIQPARTEAAETAPAPLTEPRPAIAATPLDPPAAPVLSATSSVLSRPPASVGAAAHEALVRHREEIADIAAQVARKAALAALTERQPNRGVEHAFDDLDATVDAAVNQALDGLDARIDAEVARATRRSERFDEERLRRRMAEIDERMKRLRERLNERLRNLPQPRVDRPLPVPEVQREACTPVSCDEAPAPLLEPVEALPAVLWIVTRT